MTCKGRSTQAKTLLQTESNHENQQQAQQRPRDQSYFNKLIGARIAVRRPTLPKRCIDAYSGDALAKGADLDQMTEAVHVAAAIRGGASLVHGVQMRNHADKLGM